MNRRRFIKNGIASTLSAMSGAVPSLLKAATGQSSPNLLVIVVDQMRNLDWIPAPFLAQYLPNIARLKAKSVSFEQHYSAATMCAPSRASMVTGLYSHQHGLLANTYSKLQPEFPTYGTALRQLNYDTYWFGKWHLAGGSDSPVNLEPYGFSGGTDPDPIGGPGQGLSADPRITRQFTDWLNNRKASSNLGPWCTTVSFVNPHDIAWFWLFTDCLASAEANPPENFLTSQYFARMGGLPCLNFEDAGSPSFRNSKPKLQSVAVNSSVIVSGGISWDMKTLMESAGSSCSGKNTKPFSYWYKLLRVYLYVMQEVDKQIGIVLRNLDNSPYADSTAIIFTSDHGEYGGAHGLVGKGYGVYDESIRVPLFVYDPNAKVSPGSRFIMTSSVDIMPLLLTLASHGSTGWTGSFPYLSSRLNIANIVNSPMAPGRPYILHTCDESVPGNEAAPHIIAYRTAQGKIGVYSHWDANFLPQISGEEYELYDYRGRDFSEVKNVYATSSLYATYYSELFKTGGVFQTELRAPLPENLLAAQQTAYAAYSAKKI